MPEEKAFWRIRAIYTPRSGLPPKATRAPCRMYRLLCGDQEYGLSRMEELAREFQINGPGHGE